MLVFVKNIHSTEYNFIEVRSEADIIDYDDFF